MINGTSVLLNLAFEYLALPHHLDKPNCLQRELSHEEAMQRALHLQECNLPVRKSIAAVLQQCETKKEPCLATTAEPLTEGGSGSSGSSGLQPALQPMQEHPIHVRKTAEADVDDVFVSDSIVDQNPALQHISAVNSSPVTLAREKGDDPACAPADARDIVLDKYELVRDRAIEKRRKMLMELFHPNPLHYTYDGALVPPPPISFEALSPEAYALGRRLLVDQHYSLVRQAPASDYFFEINDLYMEIAFVGRANAGKSSLINAVLGQHVAKTSSTPNTTRQVNFYQAATPDQLKNYIKGNPNRLVKLPAGGLQLTMVDVPGFGIDGMSDEWRDSSIAATDSYLGQRRSVNTVFLCIDVHVGITKTDAKYFTWLQNLHGVYWVLLTKCDSVPHSRICAVMKQLYMLCTKRSETCARMYPFVLPLSARTGVNVDTLRALIVETSGIIEGTKLRKLLESKAHERLMQLAREEQKRLDQLVPRDKKGRETPSEMALPSTVPARAASADECAKVRGSMGLCGHCGTIAPGVPVLQGKQQDASLHPAAWEPPPKQVVSSAFAASMKSCIEEVKLHHETATRHASPGVYVEQSDGSVAKCVAGEPVEAPVMPRQGATSLALQNARRIAMGKLREAQKVAPSAPWTALPRFMTAKERDAYVRSAGKPLDGEAFLKHVAAKQYENETRVVRSKRKEEELNFAAHSRVSYGTQPVGMWKHYGESPTQAQAAGPSGPSRVMGL